jgi:TatD DNase family protein
MLFDTHCHLNFKIFDNKVEEVIGAAHDNGISSMVVVGTDEGSSKKAVGIAEEYEGIYAAVGVHPHHVYKQEQKIGGAKKGIPTACSLICGQTNPGGNEFDDRIYFLKELLTNKKVVAIGEMGIDKYEYKNTKYSDYKIDKNFIEAQKKLFNEQIKLAFQYDKSLIIHNRRAREDILGILNEVWDKKMEYKTVFHCCEPDKKLLRFAQDHKIFMGIDGDVTYYKEKQAFVKNIPLELLVLETDAPYLMPEPIRSEKKFPNEPKNIKLISNFIAQLIGETGEKIAEVTTNNAKTLFGISLN